MAVIGKEQAWLRASEWFVRKYISLHWGAGVYPANRSGITTTKRSISCKVAPSNDAYAVLGAALDAVRAHVQHLADHHVAYNTQCLDG